MVGAVAACLLLVFAPVVWADIEVVPCPTGYDLVETSRMVSEGELATLTVWTFQCLPKGEMT